MSFSDKYIPDCSRFTVFMYIVYVPNNTLGILHIKNIPSYIVETKSKVIYTVCPSLSYVYSSSSPPGPRVPSLRGVSCQSGMASSKCRLSPLLPLFSSPSPACGGGGLFRANLGGSSSPSSTSVRRLAWHCRHPWCPQGTGWIPPPMRSLAGVAGPDTPPPPPKTSPTLIKHL